MVTAVGRFDGGRPATDHLGDGHLGDGHLAGGHLEGGRSEGGRSEGGHLADGRHHGRGTDLGTHRFDLRLVYRRGYRWSGCLSTETRGCRPWAPGAEVIETEIWGLSLPLD